MNDRVIELLEKQCAQLDQVIELLTALNEDKQRYVVIGQQPKTIDAKQIALSVQASLSNLAQRNGI